jgi:PKD repeat protein
VLVGSDGGTLIAAGDDQSASELDFEILEALDPGTYFVRVMGFDGSVTGPYELLISADALAPPGNQMPVASFSVTPSQGVAPLQVTLDAFSSSDADGTIVSYIWNFGDGSASGSGMGVTHLYPSAGSYTITLTVTDNNGSSSSTTRQVTVTSSGGGGGGGAGGSGSGGGGLVSPVLLIALGALLFSGRRRKAPTPVMKRRGGA